MVITGQTWYIILESNNYCYDNCRWLTVIQTKEVLCILGISPMAFMNHKWKNTFHSLAKSQDWDYLAVKRYAPVVIDHLVETVLLVDLLADINCTVCEYLSNIQMINNGRIVWLLQ